MHALRTVLFALLLFGGVLLLIEIGRRVGHRRIAKDPEHAFAGAGAVDGAVFGLLGLLVAFTFSGAAARFDARRQLIIEEANDIGTAYLRLDVLPTAAQPALRDRFRAYVDSRLAIYRALPDMEAARAELARSVALQGEIWQQAVAASGGGQQSPAAILVLPALNAMFDITTTRTWMAQMHPPVVIFGMLFVLAFASALLAGYGMSAARERSWVHNIGFALVLALTVYVILDLEYPRLGLLRVDAFDQALVDVRAAMR